MARTCRPKHARLNADDKQAYLELLRQGLTLSVAARQVGFHPSSFERLRKEDSPTYDPEFTEEFAAAWQAGGETLVETARVRAVEGTDVTTIDRAGNEHVTKTPPSDRLLEFLIKQRDPSFRDSQPAVALNTGAVFILESAFDRPAIEGEVVEVHAVELPERPALSERSG